MGLGSQGRDYIHNRSIICGALRNASKPKKRRDILWDLRR